MRVDVRGRRNPRMLRTPAYRPQRNPRRKQQLNARVPQGVNQNVRQIGPQNEVVEPACNAVGVNRRAVVLRE